MAKTIIVECNENSNNIKKVKIQFEKLLIDQTQFYFKKILINARFISETDPSNVCYIIRYVIVSIEDLSSKYINQNEVIL